MRTILILCLSILFLPLTLAAEGLTVIGGTENTDYSYADNVYTVLTETALTFSGTTTTDRIVVKEGVTANITLDNIDISFSDGEGDDGPVGTCAFYINDHAIVKLKLININSLQSGAKCAAIQIEKNATVEIQGEGTLNAQGGWGGAGIGAGDGTSCGTIRIKSGTVNAYAGDWAFGLGGGCFLNVETYKEGIIIIDGGDVTAKGEKWASSSIMGNITLNGGSVTTSWHVDRNGAKDYRGPAFGNITIAGNVTIKDWTVSDPFTPTGGTFTNCTFSSESFVDSGTFTNCTFSGESSVDGGTFTNCTFSGKKFVMYKGTINNTEDKNIAANDITITGGNINIQLPQTNCTTSAIQGNNILISGGNIKVKGGRNDSQASGGAGIRVLENDKLTITGGNIYAEGGRDCTGIGGIRERRCGTIIIEGGTITAIKGDSGGSSSIGGGYGAETSGTLEIYGGSLLAFTIKATIKEINNNKVYLGITPEIANATDVSVDGVPYYISGNHPDSDNKLYLYMTGVKHTITVRTNDNKVTTYPATYVPGGVDGDGNSKGYFTFDAGSTTTPSDNSAITFEAKDITTTYNKENNELKVKLTVTEKVTTRSAAMNSVQLTLTDGTNTYYSDRQTVTGSDEYTFTFDTQGLDAGNYTLTANYGGSATSLAADEQTKTLTIEKATPIYIIPSGLSVTYGKTLADINLPDGWAWNASETSVGNVSSSPKTFAATFTPADTKNYNTVVENLSITVNKAEASNPKDPEVTSSSPVTYGAKLSDITISDGWQWEDGTIVPTVTNSGYMAYYPVTNYDNYDWSKINDYDEANHRVRRSVSVTVNKADLSAADFTFTAPSDLVYNGSAKAATVTAKDGLIGVGSITLKYYKENVATATDPIEVGNYTVKINVDGGNNYNNVTDLEVGKFSILPKRYAIAIDPAIANGTVTADKTQAVEDETVTLTVTPAQGYEQETLSYTTDGGTTETITGTTFVMPAADVTVTATFKASSVPPVNPPVDPDEPDEPDPAPVRYTVTLPTVEGAATDPAAGSYEVESWGNFSFLLTLGEGYRKDSHPVVTARGETLTPNASTGKYIIPNVQSDITVGITGIVKDVATGNESLTDGFHITTSGGLLLVTVPHATRLYLTDTSGRLILSRLLPAGDTRIDDLAAGVYLLTLEGEKTKKIIIR